MSQPISVTDIPITEEIPKVLRQWGGREGQGYLHPNPPPESVNILCYMEGGNKIADGVKVANQLALK